MHTGTGIKKNSAAFFDSGLREYALVIYPDVPVYERIMAEKQYLQEKYGVECVMGHFPCITVGRFYAREGMEETLMRWIERICCRLPGFALKLNNYGGLPDHSIFLRVQDPQPFRRLLQELKILDDYVQVMDDTPPGFRLQPRMML